MRNVIVQSGEFKIIIGDDGAGSVKVFVAVPNRGELCLGSFANEFHAHAFLRDFVRVLQIALQLSAA